jgi:hypothetical protein
MKVDDYAVNIRKVYGILTGKTDNDVLITYRGTSYGQGKPWHVRIDARESASASLEQALSELFLALKQELATKALDSENQAKVYRQALSNLEN